MTTPGPNQESMAEGSPSIEDRLTGAFERVATTAERVGIPIATFAMGALAIGLATQVQIEVLPWIGTVLILTSLATYLWLTARSTVRVQSPPAPIPKELNEQLEWMRQQIAEHSGWMRNHVETLAKRE